MFSATTANGSVVCCELACVAVKQEPADHDNASIFVPPPSSLDEAPLPGWANQNATSLTSGELLVCEVCQAEFAAFETLLLHKLCHFNTRHVCYVCDCFFADTDALIVHIATLHRQLARADGYYKTEVERAFACRCVYYNILLKRKIIVVMQP